MNICFITSEFPDAQKGGIERVVCNLMSIYAKNGHKVITLSKDPPTMEFCKERLSFYLEDNSNILCLDNVKFATNLIQRFSVDIIIYASHHKDMFELALKIKKQTNCKLVTTYYNCPNALLKGINDEYAKIRFTNKSQFVKFIRYLFLKLVYWLKYWRINRFLEQKFCYQYENSNAFIVESPHYIKILESFIGQKNCPNIYAIPNPISKISYTSSIPKSKIVLYIARMNLEQKRPDRILRIWKKIQKNHIDWELLMIGDGPERDKLIKYAHDLELVNIKFIGNSELQPYYERAEILCMTSSYEGFGLVLTEAFQNEVIPIAFNSYEAIQDIIQNNKTGILIKPFDEDLYAKQLSILMQDDTLRDELRENIRHIGLDEKYGDSTIYSCWLRVFNSI